jgi:hypothetical protein
MFEQENNITRKNRRLKNGNKQLIDERGMTKEKKKSRKKTKKDQEQIMEEDKAYSTRELEEDFS